MTMTECKRAFVAGTLLIGLLLGIASAASGHTCKPGYKHVKRAGKHRCVVPPIGSSRTRPVPVQTARRVKDWKIAVAASLADATQAVMAENMFNEPPQEGHQFFVARLRATYVGQASDSFDAFYRARAVGASSVAYSTFENSCGVIPDPMPDSEVFPGGTVEGNVCWEIRSTDAASLIMYDQPFLSDTRTWFALR